MTRRQEEYLKMIIENFIQYGVPISSTKLKTIINNNIKNGICISSNKFNSAATIRKEMNLLEKENMLEKTHISSGSIPSTQGYKFFAKYLANQEDEKLKKQIKIIFSKRNNSIDNILDEAANKITNIVGLTLVTTSSITTNELLKSIQLTPLSKKEAIIVLVTSTGRVESKVFTITNSIHIEDLRIAIRLFKERLINTPLKNLILKTNALKPILAKYIKNYEELIQTFIMKIFNFNNSIQNKVYGNSNIIRSNINRIDLANLIKLIENKSIWSSIEGQLDEDETMKIDIQKNNISIVSKKFKHYNKSKEISILGTNRMNYAKVKQIINATIKELIKKNN